MRLHVRKNIGRMVRIRNDTGTVGEIGSETDCISFDCAWVCVE